MNGGKISNTKLVGLLILAGIGLLAGLYTGLRRLGLPWQSHHMLSPLLHGPLMINGFLGTLIGLERAAALERKWSLGAPVVFALATLSLLLGFSAAAKLLLIVGSSLLLLIMIFLYRMQAETYHLIMILGAGSLLIGNILFLWGHPVFNLVAWWAGFLLLTIFAERLELNRIMRPPQGARQLFLVITLGWIIGIVLTYVDRRTGWAVASFSLIAQALWLFNYDVARRTIKASGWTRYSAICLLTGYGWLVAAGLFGLGYGFPTAGFLYDAQLHMIFVGFVFSMIFAHASVIIPSLSGKLVKWHTYFYFPLLLLHACLLLRIAGDISIQPWLRRMGGYGNVLAILLFLIGIVSGIAIQTIGNKRTAGKQAV